MVLVAADTYIPDQSASEDKDAADKREDTYMEQCFHAEYKAAEVVYTAAAAAALVVAPAEVDTYTPAASPLEAIAAGTSSAAEACTVGAFAAAYTASAAVRIAVAVAAHIATALAIA